MPTLKVPATLDNLQVVNAFIEENLPENCAFLRPHVELVAEELLVNVFMYAYEDDTQGEAEVGCREVFLDDEEYFCFWVCDNGRPFNPFVEAPEPDLTSDAENRPIGGLGIHLIKSLTKHYSYSYTDKRNLIELYFSKVENA